MISVFGVGNSFISACFVLLPSPDRCFMSVPPSLLACACICDAISHCCTQDKYLECVASLTQLAGIDQVRRTMFRSSKYIYIYNHRSLPDVVAVLVEAVIISHFSLQEILFQHQKNVSEVFLKKLEQSAGDSKCEEQYTPNDIESVEEQEFGQGRFVYNAVPSVGSSLARSW